MSYYCLSNLQFCCAKSVPLSLSVAGSLTHYHFKPLVWLPCSLIISDRESGQFGEKETGVQSRRRAGVKLHGAVQNHTHKSTTVDSLFHRVTHTMFTDARVSVSLCFLYRVDMLRPCRRCKTSCVTAK